MQAGEKEKRFSNPNSMLRWVNVAFLLVSQLKTSEIFPDTVF